jgi:hypothetical protein
LVYSPSLMTSMPTSHWRSTTSATVHRNAASSSPAPAAASSGRGRLPTWVVRILLVLLRFTFRSRYAGFIL